MYAWAREGELTGLCLSGGGIRSATFNLGILQGLAAKKRLTEFDYLSTVSGGGYIHSWLAAWLQRRTKEEYEQQQIKNPDQAMHDGLEHVMERLQPLPVRGNVTPPTSWPRQVQWLRQYSNYLTPQVGLFTGDTWTAVATWLRNVLLNQSLLISVFLLLLLIPHLLVPHTHLIAAPPVPPATTSTLATLH